MKVIKANREIHQRKRKSKNINDHHNVLIIKIILIKSELR